ncbi:MFS transporter [Arcanobacterium ihumii]|uniref:MFS transporter n=1 Tax=Arcanobacterium ihumii TaxID=2138162 RepID=UPI000F5278E0|nr:MFS transporter [Arcanobacterium ihumii]
MSTTTADPSHKTRNIILVGLIFAVVAFQLNATMLNPAVKQMESALSATTAQIAFTTSLFFLSKAIFQIFMPRLSDMQGRRKILIITMGILIVGTVISMLAPNVAWLYVGRAIQGACGPVFSIALLILRESTADEKEYGSKLGLIIAINGGVAGIDVILGGWMADNWGFRSILAFTLAITLVALYMIIRWVPESHPSQGEKMDWVGVVFLSIFFVTVSWAVGSNPFFLITNKSTDMWIWIGTAVVAMIAFILWEKSTKTPLIPRAHLTNRAIWFMPLTTILTLTSIMAIVNLVVPSFTQNPDAGWGMEASTASLLFMSPYALVGWIAGPFAGRLAGTYGYRFLLRASIAANVVILIFLALFGLSNPWVFGILIFLLGVTYAGTTNVMLNGLGVVLSPKEAPGLLPGLNGASFGIGASLSFALLGKTITAGSPKGSESIAGYQNAIWIGVGIMIATLLVSMLLPKPSADQAAEVEK